MAETLTIRLDAADRAVLEAAARKQGKGLSAFIREMAEATARQVRRDTIQEARPSNTISDRSMSTISAVDTRPS